MENEQNEDDSMDHEEYKHNVFKVLTKNVPKEVLNVK